MFCRLLGLPGRQCSLSALQHPVLCKSQPGHEWLAEHLLLCVSVWLQSQSAPPGAYQVPGALGRQVVSTKESAPGIKIGTSLRALDYEVGAAVTEWC